MSIEYVSDKLSNVFRSYDIRGKVNNPLNDEIYYQIGQKISRYLMNKNRTKIYIARDNRLSSKRFFKAITKAFINQGIEVYNLGVCPTPIMLYACKATKIDSGVIITASHNPCDYNGLKLFLAGKLLTPSELIELKNSPTQQNNNSEIKKRPVKKAFHIAKAYCRTLLSQIKPARRLKIVIDCANGVTGKLAPQLFKKLGCQVIPLYTDSDGTFPNHEPDPALESNLVQLKHKVVATNADLGIAFDGDGDRLGVISAKGEFIASDKIMMLFVKDILSERQGLSIVFDIKCSATLNDYIIKNQGKAIMSPTGGNIIKRIMKKYNASLGGEYSGHFYFQDSWYGIDDAIYAASRLIQLVAQHDSPLSDLIPKMKFPIGTPELYIACDDYNKHQIIQEIVKNCDFKETTLTNIDGIRVDFSNGWGLLRASNTSNNLTARFEAKSKTELINIIRKMNRQINRVNEKLQIPLQW